MAEAGHDALVLTAAGAVRYASGAVPPHGDSSVEAARPFAAVVTARTLDVLGIEPTCVPADLASHPLPRAPARAAAVLADLLAGARHVGVIAFRSPPRTPSPARFRARRSRRRTARSSRPAG